MVTRRCLATTLLLASLLAALAFTGVKPTAEASSLRVAPALSGRVYEGNVGDDRYPLGGITMQLFASHNAGNRGVVVAEATTDAYGWYSLDVEAGFEYYFIVESDRHGMESVGATSVDGVVLDPNTIRYDYPLTGKTLTGNRFWDRWPASATGTPTPTRTPTEPAPSYTLTGRVYEGQVGDESHPLTGVTVELYASNNAGALGLRIDLTKTNADGWYAVQVGSALLAYEYYTIVELDPEGYSSVNATSVSGVVVNHNTIRYSAPLQGKTLSGNRFWDLRAAQTTPTHTATRTATLPAPASHTATRTATLPAPASPTATQPLGKTPTPTTQPEETPTPPEGEPAVVRTFSGRVAERPVGDGPEVPVYGARLRLYGSQQSHSLGEELGYTLSERDGSFVLSCLSGEDLDLAYYFVVLDDPNYLIVEALPGEGGEIAGETWIRFHLPVPGDYPGNQFLVRRGEGDLVPREVPPIVPGGFLPVAPVPQPSTTPPAPVDIFIRGVEWTQAIQCFDTKVGYNKCPNNSLEMTAGKLTALRVYVGCTGCSGSSVKVPVRVVRAYCSKGSSTAPGGCTAWGGPATKQLFSAPLGKTLHQLREMNSGTANWILPTATSEITLYLDVQVNWGADALLPETKTSNNRQWLQIPLVQRPSRVIKWALLDIGTGLADPKHAGAASYWMSRLYPYQIQYSQHNTIKYTGDQKNMMDYLETLWVNMQPLPDHLLGWLPTTWGCSGRGRIDAAVAYLGQCSSLDYSAYIAAHEVGHNMNMDHPEEIATPTPLTYMEDCWPFPGNSEIKETGYDPVAKQVVSWTTSDNMRYSTIAGWVAPYTWNKWLRESFSSAWAKVKQGCASSSSSDTRQLVLPAEQLRFFAAPQQAILISGRILPDGGGQLDPFFERSSEGPFSPPDPGGELCLDLQTATGGTLASHCFDLGYDTAQDGDYRQVSGFAFVLPFLAGTGRVELRRGGQVLATRAASPHPPWVSVTQPTAGALWDGLGTIAWEAGDDDGDSLQFMALYSPDDGTSWSPLTVASAEDSLEVETSSWAGSRGARVRILASDGFHTAQADSPPFVVPRKPPNAWVHTPGQGQFLHIDEAIVLTGYADDLEDGPLAGPSLTWHSDRQGPLGFGEQLALPPGWLEAGEHTLILSAVDSDQQVGEESVTVFIGYPVYLPLIHKP